MRPEFPRRTVLATGVAALGTALAGCSGGSDEEEDAGTPDPDEGTDSYGIHLVNDARETHEVDLKAAKVWEDETVFEETIEIDPDESMTWHQVITEEVEHSVIASLGIGDWYRHSTSRFITPGQEDSPDIAHVEFEINWYEREIPGQDETEPRRNITVTNMD